MKVTINAHEVLQRHHSVCQFCRRPITGVLIEVRGELRTRREWKRVERPVIPAPRLLYTHACDVVLT